MGGSKSYDFCSQPGPVGEVCGITYSAIGNSTTFYALANQPTVRLLITAAVVPEPASWAMMIAGCGLAGSASRRAGSARRATLIA